MATTSTHLCFSPSLPLSLPSPSNPKNPQNFLTLKKRCGKIHQQQSSALGSDMVGDFGARDPYPAEIATNFGEKVFGNGNTEHKILIPNLSALSLSQQECIPISSSLIPLSYGDAQQLLRKV
ncbi:hypothetical protein GIB67_027996 [Kingdonia uniflora]|uniref:Uncharacterized protein n=1 Tax=Kingdonia uniflora TaxID=39325 RepID=A0A7J7L780_9MAGN|nr:hypothetical protein GIB67_027996 [Kingdonia uniflora]